MKKNNPIVVINLKTYKSGKDVLKLCKIIEKIDKKIIVGVSPVDISEIVNKTKLTVYSQHVDPLTPGRNTGYIIPEAIKSRGATGVFLNHSEHPLDHETIEKSINRCKEIGLKTFVFARSKDECLVIEKLAPDYLCYEPPELVAGTISVSTAKPEVISDISNALKMKVLVGAGVKNNLDLRKSLELGSSGIALSSAITQAENPGKVLKELLGKK